MKKIAVIGLRGFPSVQGGVEVHCENLYPLFSNNVEITIYRRIAYLSPSSNHTYNNIFFVDYPSTRIKGFEAVFHTFLSCCHIITHRPNIVHIHNIGPGLFTPLLKLFGFKVCVTYHSPNYEHKKWGFIAQKILRLGEWLSLNYADNVIFVNKFQKDKVSVLCQGKSHYIPNGINRITRSTESDFLEKNKLKKGKYVLAVGRITEEKGFDILVQAVSKLPEVENLVIAGACDHDKIYYEKLKALDIHNKVVFTGFTTGENLRQLYSHARLFVLSSYNEGFPLVLLEAMGYGLPLVVSDIPATHLVKLPTDNYVCAGNFEAFSSAIGKKWKEATTSVAYDLSEFDWNLIAEKTEHILVD